MPLSYALLKILIGYGAHSNIKIFVFAFFSFEDTIPSMYGYQGNQLHKFYCMLLFQDTEKYVIYNVNKEEYDTCRIMSNSPRIVAYCTEPYVER